MTFLFYVPLGCNNETIKLNLALKCRCQWTIDTIQMSRKIAIQKPNLSVMDIIYIGSPEMSANFF